MSKRLRMLLLFIIALSGGVLLVAPRIASAQEEACEVGKDCDGCTETCCPGMLCGCYLTGNDHKCAKN